MPTLTNSSLPTLPSSFSNSSIMNIVESTRVLTSPTNWTSRRDDYKKNPSQRIFVGRSLRLEKIKFFGFDMDYTLANYKSPQYETLLFQKTIDRLIQNGYPDDLRKLSYDSSFPVRGLWFDSLYGNLLKVDGFGNILTGTHGTNPMKMNEIEEVYPNKFIKLKKDDKRIIILNTLFNLSDTYLLAKLVEYLDALPNYKQISEKTGVRSEDVVITYKSISQDLIAAVNWVHTSSETKNYVLQHIDDYIHKAEDLTHMMVQLRSSGAKTFLLTNSDYKYTNGVMTYLAGQEWPLLFDAAIVDAKKPDWFSESSVFRQIDTTTGARKVEIHMGPLKRGQVYAGGSCDAFRRQMKVRGKDVLYVGDHIFGDVLKSKKNRGWRTFLIIPELNHELTVWTEQHQLFETLTQLDTQLGRLYKNLDCRSSNSIQNEINDVVRSIRNVTHETNQAYGLLGSLFRTGPRTTFFATQVERYADLYSSSPYNLINYPKFYFFRAPMVLLPHESAVDHLSQIQSMSKKINTTTSQRTSFCQDEIEDEGIASPSGSEVPNDVSNREDYSRKENRKSID